MIPAFRHFQRPLALLRPHRFRVLAGVVLVLLYSLLKLWMASIIAGTVDRIRDVESGLSQGGLLVVLGSLVLLILIEGFARLCARRLIIQASRHVEAALKSQLFAHISRLPMTWFDKAKVGDLISRLTQDVELLRFLIGPAILYGSSALALVPLSFVMMANLSLPVTMLVGVVFTLLLISMALLMPRMQEHSRKVQEDIADISQWAQESFSGIRVILNYAKAHHFGAEMGRRNQRYLQDNMAMVRYRAWIHLFVHLCTDLTVLAVMVMGGLEVVRGNLSLGGMFQFLLIMGFLTWPLMAMGWILGSYHRARSAMQRIEEIMATPPESAAGKELSLRGELRVQNLSFCYQGQERNALQAVSFQLQPGQKLGLVGPVGGGKSTLLALLVRLYDPPRGSVFVDGQDVLDLDLASLRQLFAMAPQDPFLFSDTIAGNVGFGGVDSQDIQAQALFTADMDADMDTVIGERGITLSGGQRQRVSLARALAVQRPALVLDDTLSAVDHGTEQRILQRLAAKKSQQGVQQQSLLVASHRLSAVQDADLILVLQEGRVVEQGNHAHLLQVGGLYARAYRLQKEERALGGEEVGGEEVEGGEG